MFQDITPTDIRISIQMSVGALTKCKSSHHHHIKQSHEQ